MSFSVRFGCLFLVAASLLAFARISASFAQEEPATTAADFEKDVRPILQTYCFTCHNTQRKRGGLDLEKVATTEQAHSAGELWVNVAERVRKTEMPPAKSPAIKLEEKSRLLAWIAAQQKTVDCKNPTPEDIAKYYPGHVMSRRLNRTEYNNTMRDLFGVDVHPGDLLPSDGGGGEGFDTTGGALFVTPSHMEKYLQGAERVLDAVLPTVGSKGGKGVPAEVREAARAKLLIATPGTGVEPRTAAREILTSFARRAFRRSVNVAEIDRYMTLFDKASQRGDSFEQSLRLAMKGMLISPHFLFLVETQPQAEGAYRLADFALASRLSYFLWSSMPDDELLTLAESGKLHEEATLRTQVKRLVADPRSRGLAESFAVQWLDIEPLGVTVRPDKRTFQPISDTLIDAMKQESILYFDAVVREDRSLLDLIDSDFTFVNEPLAALYKIEGVKGAQMRKVTLKDHNRGGVLGQASVLAVTSFPLRTSPVLRGKWVLEAILGSKVPPPPPNVPILQNTDNKAGSLTMRQRLEKHRKNPECATCHDRMDPIGFGLENYDAIGRWRTEEAGKAVDSLGVLPSGETFNGPAELKKYLLGECREAFVRNFSRKMLGYALGREVNPLDQCVVDDCYKSLESGEFKVSRLLETIVLSYPYNYRYAKRED